ncbi:glutamate carboxypeptidase [Pseudoduganella sp. UC29_71]|uniref:glutamate carboxypeptidase n=1 Tax=Pseudoduganella sp. UC29_71 TaxID=3350174 RepID=UPI00366AAD31
MSVTRGVAAVLVALAGASAGSAAAAEAGKVNQALLAKAEQAKPEALKLLERLVNIDSGTFNGAGLDRVGAIAVEELKRLGAKVETFPATPAMSRNIQATLTGTGKGRILLVAHMDTVFPDGAAAARPFRIEGTRAYGPGIMDDKGGIVVALAALKILKQSGDTGYGKITLLLNTNEETGSHGTRALMDKLAREHDVALNLEPGRAADGLVVMRKGSGEIELDVTGKAAHAGVAPEAGRNAAMEAAHQVLQLSKLADPGKQTTVNFTVIKAGERTNVIPDHATAQADVRVAVPEEFDRVEQDLARISANHLIPDTKVSARLRRGFPPMPKSPVTDAVAAKAQAVYGELGRKLTLESSGGAADSSLTFATGVPTIDGLGIVGGGIHTPEEYAEVESIAPRAYLLARLIQEYGK